MQYDYTTVLIVVNYCNILPSPVLPIDKAETEASLSSPSMDCSDHAPQKLLEKAKF